MRLIRAAALLSTASLLAGCSGIQSLLPGFAERPAPQSQLTGLAADVEARGDAATALALYQRAATDGSAAAQIRLGEAYLRHGQIASAIAAYKAALARDPGSMEAELGLGLAELRSGDVGAGLAHLRAAAPKMNTAVAYNRLAAAEAMVGEVEAARASFQMALSLAPGDLDLKTNLALLAAVTGRGEDAIAGMQDVVRAAAAQAGHERNYVLVLGLAGREADARRLASPSIPKRQIAEILARAKAIRALRDAAARSRALGTVTSA
ncbi:tetratricopeptide repeat protein [Chelatococcus sp. GCM10030263]|uniref:tetratricopeptide repeat protein n=1 Tax=Chelatococcus sp. GCM10030263 TaxID=3273387 RepID=UPI003613CBD7